MFQLLHQHILEIQAVLIIQLLLFYIKMLWITEFKSLLLVMHLSVRFTYIFLEITVFQL